MGAPQQSANVDRREFLGGSDARIIMGTNEASLTRLWREKRGELEPLDLSGELVVQLGRVTEALNVAWYERLTGHRVGNIQARMFHRSISFMSAAVDGIVNDTGAVFEAKFMLPWSFSEDAAAEKHMAQLQHNMLVANSQNSVLSIVTGGGKWLEIQVAADPIYQVALVAAETAFWRAVKTGEPPRLFGVEPPRPRTVVAQVVDMSSSNSWAELAARFRNTRHAYLEHEQAKSALKNLVPEGAREAIGHGLRARRAKSGALNFDLLDLENVHAVL